MLNRDELILLTVALLACIAGFLLEDAAVATSSLPSICLVVMMFLSYLSIPVGDVLNIAVKRGKSIVLLTTIKMVVLPLLVGGVMLLINPEYAVVMVLMAGICSGSSCPYFGLLLKADVPLLVVLVVATSVVVPFTLPLIIRLLCGGYVAVSPWSLAFSLSLYILLPLVCAELFRKMSFLATQILIARRKGINVFLFGITNFSVFANNAEAISHAGHKILPCFLLSCFAALLFMFCGYLAALHLHNEQRISAMISFAMTNNILVIVLSGSFFGSTELLVAALYTIPFFIVTIPIRYLSNWKIEVGRNQYL